MADASKRANIVIRTKFLLATGVGANASLDIYAIKRKARRLVITSALSDILMNSDICSRARRVNSHL